MPRRQAGRLPACQWCTVDHSLDGSDPGIDAIVAGEAQTGGKTGDKTGGKTSGKTGGKPGGKPSENGRG